MKKTVLFLSLILLLTSVISPLSADNESEKKYSMNIGDATLEEFVENARDILGIQIIYEKKIFTDNKFRFDVKPQTKPNIFNMLKKVLDLHGYIICSSGNGDNKIYFICKKNDINKLPLNPDDPDGISIAIVPINYVSTSFIVRQIGIITDNPKSIVQVDQTNSVIIKGTSSFIDSAIELIGKLDVKEAAPVTEVVHLKYKDPEKMIELLTDHRGKSDTGKRKTTQNDIVKMTADVEGNSVIITAPKRDMVEILAFIKKFDLEVSAPSKVIITKEYTIRHRKPEEIADTIGSVFETKGTFVVGGKKDDKAATPSTGTTETSKDAQSFSMPFDFEEREKPIIVYPQGQSTIIITTSVRAHKEIAKLIEMIDKRVPQVFIQAALFSVAYGTDLSIVTELSTIGKASSGISGFGAVDMGLSKLTSVPGYILEGRADFRHGGFTFGIAKGNDSLIPFVMNISQTDSNVHVHSMPSVMSDNEKLSTYITKDSAPILKRYDVDDRVDGDIITTVSDYESADISIAITPSIREGGRVKLEIDLLLESFSGAPSEPGWAPPKISNRFTGNITISDGKTLVIGGLISERTSKVANKIPILGDIPILGVLFRSTSDSVSKNVLYILITAKVLRSQEDEDKLTDEIKEKLEQAKKDRKQREEEKKAQEAAKEKDDDKKEDEEDTATGEKSGMISPENKKIEEQPDDRP